MDFASAFKRVLETGKIIIGSKRVVEDVLSGEAKLAVLSSNCPKAIALQVKQYSVTSSVPVAVFPGTSRQLGELCGKPFLVAAVSVRDLGAVGLEEFQPHSLHRGLEEFQPHGLRRGLEEQTQSVKE